MSDGATSIWKLPALSGLLFFLAYYSGLLLPNLILFLPLLLWLDLNPDASRLKRLWAGFIFGLVTHLLALHYHVAMLWISWLAGLLYAGLALVFALKISIAIALLGWLRSTTRWSYGVLLPLTWLPIEWLLTWGDLRMTADHVAHSMTAFPFLVQFADLFGTYGVGAFVLVVNGLLYESLYGFYAADRWRARLGLVILLAAVLGYDAWAWQREQRHAGQVETIRVALVQPNIPLMVKWSEATEQEQWEVLVDSTRRAAEQGAELVIWPESARPKIFYHLLEHPRTYAMRDVELLARELNVSLLVGTEYYRFKGGEQLGYYNAAFLVHPDGTLDPDWGAKVYLVPFTEAVPFERLLGRLLEGRKGEWEWLAGGFTPGPSNPLLPVRVGTGQGDDREGAAEVRVGVLVCFEQLFWDLSRKLKNEGAGLQVVITNDAWWGRTIFQSYLLNALRLRAIENRSSFVRVANTGYSGFVDPLGRYRSRTPLFEEAMEVDEVTVSNRRTVYNRIGDVVAWLAIGGLGLAVARGVVIGRRRRPR